MFSFVIVITVIRRIFKCGTDFIWFLFGVIELLRNQLMLYVPATLCLWSCVTLVSATACDICSSSYSLSSVTSHMPCVDYTLE
jgi:hypothetical protein